MTKKKLDTSERESTGQSLSDFLKNAGLQVSANSNNQIEMEKPVITAPLKQKDPLHVRIEKKGRQGKVVTIVAGFTGLTGVIEELSRKLKSQCGVGGSVKDREIVLQGDLRQKTIELLRGHGYQVKG
jgi:translation initiation factor 1